MRPHRTPARRPEAASTNVNGGRREGNADGQALEPVLSSSAVLVRDGRTSCENEPEPFSEDQPAAPESSGPVLREAATLLRYVGSPPAADANWEGEAMAG